MELNDLISYGKKKALTAFRQIAEKKCEALDFGKAMVTVQKNFEDAVEDVAKGMGFGEFDACLYYFKCWDRCKAELIRECRQELTVIQKEHAVNQVRSVQVEIIVEPKIQEAGLPYCIVYQKYRIKVCILIDSKSHFEFYIKYRDLGDSKLIDSIPEMIRANARYIKYYGPRISICSNNDETVWQLPKIVLQ